MKKKGSNCEFKMERVAALRRAYGEALMHWEGEPVVSEIFQYIVERPAPRFYVSYERALNVMRRLLRGDRTPLAEMIPTKREMFEDIERLVRKQLAAGDKRGMHPLECEVFGSSRTLESVVWKVIHSRAPKFYLLGKTAQEYVYRSRREKRTGGHLRSPVCLGRGLIISSAD